MSDSILPDLDGPTHWDRYMEDLRTHATVRTPLEVSGTLTRLAGLVLEAVGLKVPVGSQCLIGNGQKTPVLAEVVGFSNDRAFLMPAGDTHGLSSGASVTPLAPYRTVPRVGQANKPPSPDDRTHPLRKVTMVPLSDQYQDFAERFGVDLAPFPTIRRITAACLAEPAFEAARPENQPDAPKGN